ncbi:src kinase-associated phosphoprotein 2 isoform X3 [Dromiciops gliroides]|uniref:src kinase-associated phosphoprotein 2 isoform X3 n=1 Tax=Dromiciops gliroides TaxID=33562 RepID=UPI001CC5D294|nr:src kinase-associated phosphoprotein 2 isoform X3 [Dromiciops gliroides]
MKYPHSLHKIITTVSRSQDWIPGGLLERNECLTGLCHVPFSFLTFTTSQHPWFNSWPHNQLKTGSSGYFRNQFPPIAAQDLPFVLKAGYLEKRRKDHSFLGFEWQKRWCALSKTVFYYYGSDKDKQQKGEFAIDGYNVRMNNTLRKDAKRDCCFEISAPDKRIYQFTAATPRDAEEWVHQLKFVLQDMESDVIPEDEEERGELYDDVDSALPSTSPSANGQPIDDEIYEVLPEDEDDNSCKKMEEPRQTSQEATSPAADKSTDYANFYQGLWDCTGAVPDELSFKRGDVIYILSKDYSRFGWWVGEMKGTIGLVPKAYIMEMYDI